MKAVIVEIRNGSASVLSDDGCVVNIKNNGYEIGQVIQMSNPKVNLTKKITMFAASAAAVVILSVGTWAYASPYSYVSLDVNPSIEFTVNRFDRVLKVKAVNDDGEEILKEISLEDLKNETIQNALTTTVNQISEAGYFDGPEEGGIIIATSAEDENKAEELAQDLQETVEKEVTENGDNVVVEALSVGLERVQEARELGVTPGKLNLVEKLQASAADPESVDIEEWLNKPVKDIMKATKENRKSSEAPSDPVDVAGEEDSNKETTQDLTEEQTQTTAEVKTQNTTEEQAKVKDQNNKTDKGRNAQVDKAQIKTEEKTKVKTNGNAQVKDQNKPKLKDEEKAQIKDQGKSQSKDSEQTQTKDKEKTQVKDQNKTKTTDQETGNTDNKKQDDKNTGNTEDKPSDKSNGAAVKAASEDDNASEQVTSDDTAQGAPDQEAQVKDNNGNGNSEKPDNNNSAGSNQQNSNNSDHSDKGPKK